LELTPAALVDLAVDAHLPGADRLLGLAAGVHESSDLEELAQSDALASGGNFVERCGCRHALMLVARR